MRSINLNLKGVKELLTDECVQEAPEFCQKYLDLGEKEKIVEGGFFKVKIKQHSNTNTGAGIAYSNNLIVSQRKGNKWKEVFSTGMIQYRGAYNDEIDNWDLSFRNPAILEETKNRLILGIITGEQNVKIYQIKNGKKEVLEVFNVRDHESTKKRIKLLEKVINDESAFRDYVEEKLGHSWYRQDTNVLDDGNIVLVLCGHADRDYDAVDNLYMFFVLIKGVGVGVSQSYPTEIRHSGKFYRRVVEMEKSLLVDKSEKVIKLMCPRVYCTYYWSGEKVLINIPIKKPAS